MVAVLAVFLAVAPGLLGPWLDSRLDEDGSYRTKGLFPFTHTGVPFGFELDELPDLKVRFALLCFAFTRRNTHRSLSPHFPCHAR